MDEGVLASHFRCHLFHIFLSFDINAGDAGQIDDSEIWSVIGVDAQLDRIIDDLSPLARHIISQLLDIAPHFCKVCVFLSRCVILEDRIGLAISLA